MRKFLSRMYEFESLAKNRIISFKVYLILFFSYLLALLIPILSITLFFNLYFTGIFEKEILTGNLTNLQQAAYMINSQMQQISIVKDQITSDETIKQVEANEMATKGVELIKKIRNRIMVLSFVKETVLYYHEDEYAFSSETSYNLRNLYLKYQIENCSYEQFIQMINAKNEKQALRAKDSVGNKYLILMYSLPDYSTINYNYNIYNKTLIFVVPDYVFINALVKRLSVEEQNTYILDRNGNELISSGSLEGFKIDDFNSFEYTEASNMQKSILVNNEKYFVTSVDSDVTDWTYISFISAKSIGDKIVTSKFRFFWFLVFLFTFGIAVVLLLTTMSYRPIKKLKYNIRDLFPTAEKNCSEIDYVTNAIGSLLNENKTLQSDLRKQVGITKDYLYFRLLKGDVKTIREFNDMGKHAGVSINKPLYMVAVVHSNNIIIDNVSSFIFVSDKVKSFVPSDYECFIKDNSGYNSAVLIFAMESFDKAEVNNILLNIILELNKEFASGVTIGIGKQYTSLCEISKSYVEAMAAASFRHIINNNSVIFFENINELVLSSNNYPFSLGQLKSSIIQYKKKEIGLSLISVIEYVKNENTSIVAAKKMCLGILYHVVEYFNKLGDINPLCEYSDIFHISEFDKREDYTGFIDHLYNCMQAALDQQANPEANSIIIEMISYIKANYHLFDFSLQKMSDQFNMPTSVISQYFKDYTDMNIVDYLAELRIHKAKELLTNSQMDIKDISVEVGYYNVNSFIRRFKQLEGITPGDFRKENAFTVQYSQKS